MISDERISQLEKLRFEWNSDNQLLLTISWNEWLSDLIELNQQSGQYDVPQKYAKRKKLGGWVRNQRIQYRLLHIGKKSLISDKIIAQLENLDSNGKFSFS